MSDEKTEEVTANGPMFTVESEATEKKESKKENKNNPKGK